MAQTTQYRAGKKVYLSFHVEEELFRRIKTRMVEHKLIDNPDAGITAVTRRLYECYVTGLLVPAVKINIDEPTEDKTTLPPIPEQVTAAEAYLADLQKRIEEKEEKLKSMDVPPKKQRFTSLKRGDLLSPAEAFNIIQAQLGSKLNSLIPDMEFSESVMLGLVLSEVYMLGRHHSVEDHLPE